MILYRLRCAVGHEFEGWFRDSGSFEAQSARGLLSCPNCGTAEVVRALMAPAVRTRATVAEPPAASPAAPSPPALPDAVRATLQKVRAHVEATCEDMGDAFGREALRMHRGEAPRRGIYGSSTERERETLADEGVEVTMIPWLPRADG
ncbi:DUF1178 family protein [Rhizosaccharibacter radicis]|uniref:DUF1178 family protein n=1 Tax=Rhizosaccharibacter radicis TaxID=2782605 RepID=A0ABT1VWG4_9PROT|nr:DUF1178 family protein [Acetobacteraceae bacterium KSS12]